MPRRPELDEGGVRLICGDALAVLRGLPDASVDCILTDPPYCSGASLEAQKNTGLQGVRTSNRRKEGWRWFAADNMSTGGLVWLLRSVLVEARRVLRPDRTALVFADWRMVPHLAPALESSGLRFKNLIVWDKGCPGLGKGFRPQHEMVLEYANGSNPYFSTMGRSVIRCGRVPSQKREHKTEKPTELLRELLSVACPPGGTVLDPFCGSGSTGVACVETAREFVGCELDPATCAIARRRLTAALAAKEAPCAA